MGQAIPRQHPAVVLRSHYRQLRALLALALVLIVGLSVALVIVANDDENTTAASLAKAGQPLEYGGFNPLTGRPMEKVATPDVAVNPQTGAPIGTTDVAINPQAATPMENVATPDESRIAAAISGAQPAGDPPVSQAHPGARP